MVILRGRQPLNCAHLAVGSPQSRFRCHRQVPISREYLGFRVSLWLFGRGELHKIKHAEKKAKRTPRGTLGPPWTLHRPAGGYFTALTHGSPVSACTLSRVQLQSSKTRNTYSKQAQNIFSYNRRLRAPPGTTRGSWVPRNTFQGPVGKSLLLPPLSFHNMLGAEPGLGTESGSREVHPFT